MIKSNRIKIFMIPKVFKEVIDLGDGREISIETGKLAKQAHGSCCCAIRKMYVIMYSCFQLRTKRS